MNSFKKVTPNSRTNTIDIELANGEECRLVFNDDNTIDFRYWTDSQDGPSTKLTINPAEPNTRFCDTRTGVWHERNG